MDDPSSQEIEYNIRLTDIPPDDSSLDLVSLHFQPIYKEASASSNFTITSIIQDIEMHGPTNNDAETSADYPYIPTGILHSQVTLDIGIKYLSISTNPNQMYLFDSDHYNQANTTISLQTNKIYVAFTQVSQNQINITIYNTRSNSNLTPDLSFSVPFYLFVVDNTASVKRTVFIHDSQSRLIQYFDFYWYASYPASTPCIDSTLSNCHLITN